MADELIQFFYKTDFDITVFHENVEKQFELKEGNIKE